MKSMKTVSKPVYAQKLGMGSFFGAEFMCIKCGKRYNPGGTTPPAPQAGGKCPDTNSGNHVWQQC